MPSTTSHPTSALRAALVALGLGLLVLIVTNIYLVGRQATDENLFVNPPSRAYVVSPLEGTPGEPTGDVGDLRVLNACQMPDQPGDRVGARRRGPVQDFGSQAAEHCVNILGDATETVD